MKKIFIALGFVLFFAPAFTFAAYFNAGQNVTVASGAGIDQNAYIAGEAVVVSGPIHGDLLAAGSTVLVSSKIDQDIMTAGGTVTLAGVSAQDIRIAGGTLLIGASTTGELVAAGGTVTVTADTNIAKDSYIRGGTITFDGREQGNLDLAGGTVTVDGIVMGNLTIDKAQQVIIGSHAVIKGTMTYSAPLVATIQSGAQILGSTTFHVVQAKATSHSNDWIGKLFAFLTVFWILKLCMILLVAYLLWYCFRPDMAVAVNRVTHHFGMSLLIGFIFLVAVPAAIIVLLITIVGAFLGIIAALLYVTFFLLAFPLVALSATSLLLNRSLDLRWYHILGGAVVISLIGVVPFIGWLLYFIFYLAALGGLLVAAGIHFKKKV